MLSRKRDYHPSLLPGVIYHIYNRGNNGENVFYLKSNYHYFLTKYKKYIAPYFDTFVYCLLPNHIHFLVRVKNIDAFMQSNEFVKRHVLDFPSLIDFGSQADIGSLIHENPQIEAKFYSTVSEFISEQFRRFFMSYAKAMDVQEKRTGSLFQKKFKRLRIEKENHFTKLIYYIHANPALHGIFKDFKNYPHSSFRAILSEGKTQIMREEVLSQFGSKKEFENYHDEYVELKQVEKWMIEES